MRPSGDDSGMRITEVKGRLRLCLPKLHDRKQLLCPSCRGMIVYATKERAVLEGRFVIPEGAVVVDLTSSGSGIGTSSGVRKRKRSEESSIGPKENRRISMSKAMWWHGR